MIEDALIAFHDEPPEEAFRDDALAFLERRGVEPTASNIAAAINHILRGWAAAYKASDRRYELNFGDDDDDLAAAALKNMASTASVSVMSPSQPNPVPATAIDTTWSRSITAAPAATPGEGPHFVNAAGEGVILDRSEVWDIKTARQARSIFALLARFLTERGVLDVSELRQTDLAAFRAFLREIPKSYGKAEADFSRTCAELSVRGKALAADKRGISATTINRHFSFITAMIDYIVAQGLAIDPLVKPKALRIKTKERQRDKRAAFSERNVAALFRLPPFVGCKDWTTAAAFEPGQPHLHRALYRAPILLDYTGARREEVCRSRGPPM